MTPVLASLLAATEGSRDERCTCQPGRASDGSEHGPCGDTTSAARAIRNHFATIAMGGEDG
jgi:hypothetical protein